MGSPQQTANGQDTAAASDTAAAGPAEAFGLYRLMRTVREVELRIESLHKRGRMTGSFHSSLGQEACAVGVCSALDPTDLVTSTHRGHGHAVAKGVPVEGVFAELFGRASGVSGGRGGSMHLHHRPSGFLGQNAIVAGGLPWAAGAAWARRRQGGNEISVAFIGDGSIAQGVFHETALLARFWSSPCLIVCENNGLAHSMPSERLFGAPGAIAEMVQAMGIESRFADGRDVLEVRRVADELVRNVRGGRPGFIECEVFRVRPHSVADPDYRYRDKDSGERWMADHDPIARLRNHLLELDAGELERVDAEVERLIDEATASAEASEPTPLDAAKSFVYTSDELQARA